MIRIRISPERWRSNIGLLSSTLIITQLLAPPQPTIFNDAEIQAEYWRNKYTELIEFERSDKHSTTGAANRANTKAERWLTFEATAYTAFCPTGCIGITKTGIDVRNTIYHEGKRVIAVDPSVIALGSTVEVRLADGTTFEATAQDTGGAIKGAIIDILHETRQEAYVFGRQTVSLRIINEGKR